MKEKIIEVLKGHLDDALFCTRVWEAWSYGTMTEDDFENIPDESIEEIANDIMDIVKDGDVHIRNKSNLQY